jgi:hypothetical protein
MRFPASREGLSLACWLNVLLAFGLWLRWEVDALEGLLVLKAELGRLITHDKR